MFAAAAVTVVMVPLAQALPINFFLHPLGSPHVHLMSREASAQILFGSMITQMHAAVVVPVVMVPLAQALPDYFLCILLKIHHIAPHTNRGVAAEGSMQLEKPEFSASV